MKFRLTEEHLMNSYPDDPSYCAMATCIKEAIDSDLNLVPVVTYESELKNKIVTTIYFDYKDVRLSKSFRLHDVSFPREYDNWAGDAFYYAEGMDEEETEQMRNDSNFSYLEIIEVYCDTSCELPELIEFELNSFETMIQEIRERANDNTSE